MYKELEKSIEDISFSKNTIERKAYTQPQMTHIGVINTTTLGGVSNPQEDSGELVPYTS